jgi:hypothetical protein
MVDTKPATAKQVKEFISTPERPCTLSEIRDFMKADKAGYVEVTELLGAEIASGAWVPTT